jgi:hypothetical protein
MARAARGADATEAPLSRAAARLHLESIAAAPRPAGGPEEARARAYCANVLTRAGFDVREEPFAYSQIPGKLATPIVGAAAGLMIGAAARAGWRGNGVTALSLLVAGSAILAAGAWWLGRHGVLALRWKRAHSVNLVATRGEPDLWLMAHLDSKSQPVPILLRAGGVMGLIASIVVGIAVSLVQLTGTGVAPLWPWIAAVGIVMALPVTASIVQSRSPGALDDGSGVVTVLMVAQSLPPHTPLGVVLTSAEELGLAGARAWVAGRAPAQAINVDGVDDLGSIRLTWTRRRPSPLIARLMAAAGHARVAVHAGRLLPGALLDGVALADAGWDVVTVSRGTLGTVARIHLPGDSLARLGGEGTTLAASMIREAITSGA